MAKVVGPLHSTEARGSVGSLTYNTWRGMRIVKARGGPPGPATGARLDMLLLGKAASFNWSELTDRERIAWNLYGNQHQETQWTGLPKRLSGHSWYVRIYVRMQLLGISLPYSVPAFPITWDAFITLIDVSPGQVDVLWDIATNEPPLDYKTEVYLAGPASAGRTLTIHDALRIGFEDASTSDYLFASGPVGHYRAFARSVSQEGLVGTWSSAPFEIE